MSLDVQLKMCVKCCSLSITHVGSLVKKETNEHCHPESCLKGTQEVQDGVCCRIFVLEWKYSGSLYLQVCLSDLNNVTCINKA